MFILWKGFCDMVLIIFIYSISYSTVTVCRNPAYDEFLFVVCNWTTTPWLVWQSQWAVSLRLIWWSLCVGGEPADRVATATDAACTQWFVWCSSWLPRIHPSLLRCFLHREWGPRDIWSRQRTRVSHFVDISRRPHWKQFCLLQQLLP